MPVIDTAQTGKNIKTFICDKGITVKDIQERFGFAQPVAIYKWINGKAVPTIDNLVILADIFGVGIGDIIAVRKI